MRAIIFDVETTGMNEPEIIEAAWMDAVEMQTVAFFRFKPLKPIEFGYTNAEAALSRAFRGTSALCAVDCACEWNRARSPEHFKGSGI